MPIGQIARRLLGPAFRPVGEMYRAVFVDLGKIADALAATLPRDARCIDIGGGDGAVVNQLLRRRSDLRFILADLSADVGSFLDPGVRDRVDLRPATSVADLVAEGVTCDAVLIADVIHHVPVAARPGFMADLAALCRSAGCRLLVIKDMEPAGLRARAALWADLYITGDKMVEQVSLAQVRALVDETFGDAVISFEPSAPDPPNYCVVIRLKDEAGTPPAA